MQQRKTFTRTILRHRGFLPVTFLIFMSVLVSLAGRFSDHQQGRLNKDGIETVAVVVEKNAAKTIATDNNKGGVNFAYWVVMQFAHVDGKIQRMRRKVDKQRYDDINKGDKFFVRYDPKNPHIFQMSEDEFGTLADKIRIVAWGFFLAGCLLASHHFLQSWLTRRKKQRAG